MSRLRYNNAIGSLGGSLTSSGTTITFASAPSFATLVSPDYIPISIFTPPSGDNPAPNFEIVYLTAFTASGTTGTILRGMEGTSPISHASTDVWEVAPTAFDAQGLDTAVNVVRAYRSASFSYSANTWTKVPLDTVSYDPQGNMDVATNHRYNVSVAGYYQVNANIAGTAGVVAIAKNGTRVARAYPGASGGLEATASDVIYCAAGDYLELWIYSNDTSLLITGDSTINYLSVVLLAQAVSPSAVVNVARAYRSASFSYSANTWTKVPLDTVSYDPQGNMDVATNHRYNVSAAGYYQVNANIIGTAGTVAIYKNGTQVTRATPGYTGNLEATVSDVIYCAAGDYLELWIYSNNTSLLVTGDSTINFFSVHQIVTPQSAGNANALPAGAAYQNGVILATDLAQSAISINGSTGALTFTLAAAQQFIVKDTTGLLVPVTLAGGTYTLTPGTLPTSGNSRVVGVEIDVNGNITLVAGSSVSGTLNTGILLETNTPAVTSGRLRVLDIGIYNSSGTYKFSDNTTSAGKGVNWVDRRAWVRGAYWRTLRSQNASAGNDYATSSGSFVAIDAVNLSARIEIAAATLVKCSLKGRWTPGGGGDNFTFYVDGSPVDGTGSTQGLYSGTASGELPLDIQWETSLAAGSHLIQPYWLSSGPTATIYARASIPMQFIVEEITRQNSNNGIS